MQMRPELYETMQCLGFASRRAARAITRHFDRELRPHSLRATQFSILAMLSLRGPTPITELAKELGVERTTLSRNLDLIEAKGWIRIRPGEDARSRFVEVTPKGKSAALAALPAWRKVQSALTERIGEARARALRTLSQKSTA
jgi:DNA-binding MarR family transcriptional regulator